jgi:hypothetical protein
MLKRMGPPKSASNAYVRQHLDGLCRECPACGGPWECTLATRKGAAQSVHIAGRVMAARRAMYMASYPDRRIKKGMRVSSKCDNPRCINPNLLVQTTPSAVLERQYEIGQRSRYKAAVHLINIVRAKQKLTDEAVKAIRMDPRKGRRAAHEYGVSAEHYNSIQRGDARMPVSSPFAGLGAR